MEHQLASLYVVLVETSRSQARIIIRQFEELGIHQFAHLHTGEEALESIINDVPDLVISSLYLEDMSGSDLVLKMRNSESTIDTPFILISTTTSFRELNLIKQAGASAVLPKPFTSKDLRRSVITTMEWENPERIELEDLNPESLQVLVVDDGALARKMISRTLQKMGIGHITQASDGSEAIPMIQSNIYDLIVTDLNMPEVDGRELLRFIRNESNQSSVPVLMVTTEGDASKLAAVQKDGVSAIVDKPFRPAEIKQMIESALSD